jgi:gliding motility-associated-like protein
MNSFKILQKLLFLVVGLYFLQYSFDLKAQSCDVIYTSSQFGNDANPGTFDYPVQTLSGALTKVSGTRRTIWMAGGNYTEANIVDILDSVKIEGGYAVSGSTWTKSSAQTTTITFSGFESISGVCHRMGLRSNAKTGWRLLDLNLVTTNASGVDASNRGCSNYTIWVSASSNYEVNRCIINSGTGSNGTDGTTFTNSFTGSVGGGGGAGGVDGGNGCGCSSTNGAAGAAGTGGNPAGGGGGGGRTCGSGCNWYGCNANGGGNAAAGTGGSNATAGGSTAIHPSTITFAPNNRPATPGITNNSFYTPAGVSSNATNGFGGGGGGGGGGSDRGTECICTNIGNGNGGAGGAGGAGGTGGTGGFGGGGSFPLYLFNSNTGRVLTSLTLNNGTAGLGGNGGTGSDGQNGALGVNGNCRGGCDSQCGGRGGNGGAGSKGGRGQDGANGATAQLVIDGVTSSPSTTIPVNPQVTVSNNICTNSEVLITKASGTWILPATVSYINDLNTSSSSYTNASGNALVSVANTGSYSLTVNATQFTGYLTVYTNRALPTFAASMVSSICEGSIFNLNTPTSAAEYEWVIFPAASSTASPVAVFNTPIASWSVPVSGTTTNYRVRLRLRDNCCGWSVPVYYNFTAVSTISGPAASGATVCAGQTATLSANGSGVGTINWYSDPLGQNVLQSNASASSTYNTSALNQTTVFYVGETISGCQGALTAVQVTVSAAPNPPAGSANPVCAGNDVIMNGFGTGGTLSWFNVPTGGTALTTGSSYNAGPLTAGSYTYYVSENNGSCSSTRTSVGVLVNPAPAAPAATGTSICAGQTAVLTATGSGSILWYSDLALTSLVSLGASYTTPALSVVTTYYAAQQSLSGCRSLTATPVIVNINPLPAAPLASGLTICAGNTAELNATGSGGALNWYGDASGTTPLATGTGYTTPVLNQTTTFYVQETSAQGCRGPLTAVTVTVSPLPVAPSGIANAVCEGANVVLTGFGTGGTLSWYNVSTGGVALGTGSTYNAGPLTAGTYNYFVSENNGSCSSVRSLVSAVVNALPAAPTVTGTSVCSGNTAVLTASAAGTISWYADAALTNLLTIGSNYTTLALTSNTTYYVIQTNSNSCRSVAAPVTVNINALPAAPSATGTSVCVGSTATLAASGSGGTLNWYSDATASASIGTGASFTTSPLNQTTTFYVQETSVTNCRSLLTPVTVNVLSLPASPVGTANAVCQGSDVILSGTGSGGTISWFNVPTGGTALGTGNSYNAGALTAGNYTFYVQENNGTCNSLRVPVLALVNSNPSAPVTTPATICDGESATLSASGTGSLNWYTDAALTNLVFTGNTYSTPALSVNTNYYVVSTNANGCSSSSTSVLVSINALPAAPTSSNASICSGSTATLTASGSGGTISWYADATASNLLATAANYTTSPLTQNTSFYVQETSASGCKSAVTIVNVTIDALPNAPAATSITACEGASVSLSGIGSGTGDLVFYNASLVEIGRVTMSAGNTQGSFNIGTLTAGTYNYFVAEDNGNCLSASTSIVVTVSSGPVAPTVNNDGPACEGETIFVQASTVPGAVYNWTGPNGFSSTIQNLMLSNVSLANAGVYTLSIQLNGCASTSSSTTVSVNSLPLISGSISNNGPLCEGDTLFLNAPVLTGVNYQWTGPNGFTDNQQLTGIVNVNEVDHQGFYTLVVLDQNTGCESAPLSTLVQIVSLPQAGMATANGPLCEGNTLNLNVSEVFGATYSWTGPDGFSSSVRNPQINNVSTLNSGTYSVVVERNGCSSTVSVDVNIDSLPNTSVSPDTTIEQGQEIVLYASGGISFQWTPADYLGSPFAPATIFANAPAGTYTLDVAITDTRGCTATEKVTVTVEETTRIRVVDLFTPNGDGVNDTWLIEFLDNIGAYKLQVFSRGGLEVFYSENYTSNWDGTTKSGKKLPDGTYYYIVKTDSQEFKGAVTIKR